MSAEETKINNIYDMAGNVWEWTTETGTPDGTTNIRAVRRGGSFNRNSSTYPVCYRNGDASITSNVIPSIGFRVVLYIK